MSANQELFEFKFYEWEEKFKDKPYLKQPFGDEWEEYTWGEVGDMARRLATGLRSLVSEMVLILEFTQKTVENG